MFRAFGMIFRGVERVTRSLCMSKLGSAEIAAEMHACFLLSFKGTSDVFRNGVLQTPKAVSTPL